MTELVELVREAAPWIKAGAIAYGVWFLICAGLALAVFIKVFRGFKRFDRF